MARARSSGAGRKAAPRRLPPKRTARLVEPRWPSEAEQTLEALRAGLIDALVIPAGTKDSVYALRTFEELEEANTRLHESQERLLVLLSERERLMQDLHDGCIQSIYAVGLALEDCRGLIMEDPAHAAQQVGRAAASLNLVIQELRAFISGAPPSADIDLKQEIARIVDSIGARGPRFSIAIDGALAKKLSRDKTSQLLHIAREAISNVVRHANARTGRISLRRSGRKVRLEVVDDGRGFEQNTDTGRGLGLHHIAARVQKLGGSFDLKTSPSRGCRLLVEIVP